MYTADHGLSVGSHGLLGKQNMYEPSVRIPLIIGGGCMPSGSSDAMTCHTDLFPTISALAGLSLPESVDGVDQSAAVRGEREDSPRQLRAYYKDFQTMVSDGKMKLIRYQKSPRDGCGSEAVQLFDLSKDPSELNDLSDDPKYADIRQELVGMADFARY